MQNYIEKQTCKSTFHNFSSKNNSNPRTGSPFLTYISTKRTKSRIVTS